jgi:ATP phosphoribosyltransferase regulatory subunit
LTRIRAPLLESTAAAIDIPLSQPLRWLLDLAGEPNRSRVVAMQAYSGDAVCLRPDFTIPIVLAHVETAQKTGRYRCEGPAFGFLPQDPDQPEEFLQIAFEAIGDCSGVQGDVEAVQLAWRCAVAGHRTDLRITMGDIGLFREFVDGMGLAASHAQRLKRAICHPGALVAELADAPIDPAGSWRNSRTRALIASLPEADACAVLEEIWALAAVKVDGGRSAHDIFARLASDRAEAEVGLSHGQSDLLRRLATLSSDPRRALDCIGALAREGQIDLDASLERWSTRLDGLVAAGAPEDRMRLAIGFGRGQDFDDGFLFEIRSDALGDDAPIAWGGRHDGLPAHLGASAATGAVGCAIRPGRAWAGFPT